MEGVLLGFGIVLALVGVGIVASILLPTRTRAMQEGLTPVIYYITNPALMFILLAETELAEVLSIYTPIALLVAAATAVVYALFSRFILKRPAAQTAVGAMASCYVNAGNIGIPIALYAVGSSAPVVSVLLAQLLVIAPVFLTIFAWCGRKTSPAGSSTAPGPAGGSQSQRRSPTLARTVLRSVANPVTLGTAAGALFAATSLTLPAIIWTPLEMLGQASIPLLLMVFGMSLRGQKPLAQRSLRADVVLGSVVKLALMPVIAWAVAYYLFRVEGTALLGVVAMAALPTAQNVFLFSAQFGLKVTLVRDIILMSSLLALPASLLVAVLLG
ncbi:AEC family transporter [Arthrobacter sp. EH-1B-1]|uniref:AEC family transporter n=1 Tax=Arthrobacter vasquezii TaxID=2977629 RepID=A0ABT6CZE2_9MICC|nr:AEC family transporter [Arthrobacter vasquezii]MDF9278955.1 AEC family transporter [Arthrobacter vasquezii]